MGPRGALENFGSKETSGGVVFSRRVVGRMLWYLRPYVPQMALASVLMLAASLLTLWIPYLQKVAIDHDIAGRDLSGLSRTAFSLAAAFIGLYVTTSAQRYLLSWVGQKVLASLRSHLFHHLQILPVGYHDTHIVGATVSHVMNDVAEINDLLSQGLITLLGDLLVLVGIIVVMLTLSPGLALLSFIVLPLMAGLTWWFSLRARKAFRETRMRIAAVVGGLAQDINGVRAIQAFSQERTMQERFDELNQSSRDANIQAISLSYTFLPAVEFLGMLATAIVLWFGGRAVTNGEVTLGVVVAFLSYVTRFFQPIQELSRLYTTLQSAMAGGEQVLQILDTPPEVADQPGAIEMPEILGRIELDQVCLRYRQDTPEVLHEISLTIEPGQTVALVGPTGAGKSSIANLIGRFYEVTSGAVRVDGMDVRSVTQASLHRQVRVVPQEPFLFSRTIAENIRFGRLEATDEEMEAAARLANAHDFITALPNGYQSRVLEGGVNLSVGQRQLICIARAILANPRILILDEATANIDTLTESLIQQALERLLEGRTAVVIAHRLSTVRRADWIYVIDEGTIVEQGTHADLLAREGLYATLYKRQFLDAAAL